MQAYQLSQPDIVDAAAAKTAASDWSRPEDADRDVSWWIVMSWRQIHLPLKQSHTTV